MAMPIYTDEPPVVKCRGENGVVNFQFNDENVTLILSRHAMIALTEGLAIALKKKEPWSAEVICFKEPA